MPLTVKAEPTSPQPEPSWEARSTHRVLESRREQILDRSRKIVAAGYELLQQEGLDGLTIRAVLKKTGLSRRAFYERFADKDDLVLAVFEETIRLATLQYSEQIQALPDPIERLKLIVTCLVLGKSRPSEASSDRVNRRGAAMSREHLRLAESRPDDLQSAIEPLIALIAQQLEDGMRAGLVRQARTGRLAAFVYNLVSTTVQTDLLAGDAEPVDESHRERLAHDLWEFCRRAIAS